MTNRLAHENSPYLLQHADNPVDWYPWGEEALKKARTEDKPIFLSIGYAACHWCHVMAHESFEDQETADFLNQHFVNIKVDREERPDLDSIYMQAVVAITHQGGWPMSVFLTPDGRPFYGGTYFPPVRRFNMPSFKEVLNSVIHAWENNRAQLLNSASQIHQYMQAQMAFGNKQGQLTTQILDQAVDTLAQAYDWENGGWGQAPKFPQPMAIEFLIRRASRGNQPALDMVVHALHAMAKGGMYDILGGGFARYSVDDRWLTPHFEKMLYDNAQLAVAYLHAYLLTAEPVFKRVCEHSLDFVLREMSHPQGGFFSSLDADSEGVEGKYYVWTSDDLRDIIQDPFDRGLFKSAYKIRRRGNFDGSNILQRVVDDAQLAQEFGLPLEQVPIKLDEMHALLLAARSQRVRPATDDKILVSWNALTLAALAEAGRYLNREDYTQAAIRNATFLLEHLYQEERLLRSWRAGKARHPGYLEDYAGLVLGLLALYQTAPQVRWYTSALQLADEMVAHFSDPTGGFFDTRDDHGPLLLRPKDMQDNATPSGNALAALALLQLAAYGDRPAYQEMAEAMLGPIQDTMVRHPTAVAQWLCAADFALELTFQVAILGERDASQPLTAALWRAYRPHLVAAISAHPPQPGSPALLRDRPLQNDQPTVYVCQGFVCQQPVTTPEALNSQLQPE